MYDMMITSNHCHECEWSAETVSSSTSLKLISAEIIPENRSIVQSSQNNWDDWRYLNSEMISSAVKRIGLVNIIYKRRQGAQTSRGPGKYPLPIPTDLRTNVSYALPVSR